MRLQDISFSIRAGEILGIAGLAGNGQDELLAVLNGEKAAEAGSITLVDEDITGKSASKRRRKGLISIPEERLGHAAVAEFSLWENTLISARERKNLLQRGFINVMQAKQYADEVIDAYAMTTTGHGQQAASLSGGNLQKFVVGRELLQEPLICIALQPTWGVDAGSAATIHRSLLELAGKGRAVLVISQDIDELLTICSHLAVICEGRLSPAQPVSQVTIESIGLLMGGVEQKGAW